MTISKKFFVRRNLIFAVILGKHFKKIRQSMAEKWLTINLAEVIEQVY